MSEPNRPAHSWDRALAEACERRGRLLFRLAHGILRDGHAAEDACQQAFTKACAHRPASEHAAGLWSWLARVVINESLQLLRRRKVERSSQKSPPPQSEPIEATGADSHLRERVMAALGELPDATRVVVVLRIMEGMSGNEVKELLGCSASEVSRRLYQGMEQLRIRLVDARPCAARE